MTEGMEKSSMPFVLAMSSFSASGVARRVPMRWTEESGKYCLTLV